MNKTIDDMIQSVPFIIHGYTVQRVIKEDESYVLFRAIKNDTGRIFSMKVLHCNSNKYILYKNIKSQIESYMALPHQNIIKVYERFFENDFLFLVLDYCSKGSIEDYISNHYKFTEIQIRRIFRQLLAAISYCHAQGVAHCNLKPSSILISDDGILKLTDFNLFVLLKEYRNVKQILPSINFIAPEVFLNKECDPFKADIWSLGVIFYYISVCKLPWGNNMEEIKNNILSGNFNVPTGILPSLFNIIKKMLVIEPSKRPSAEELLKDPYFEESMIFIPLAVNNYNCYKYPLCQKARRAHFNGRPSIIKKKVLTPSPNCKKIERIQFSSDINEKKVRGMRSPLCI